MKSRILLSLLALLLSGSVSAQTNHFQYSHDTLGNRVSRVFQGSQQSSISNVDTSRHVTTELADDSIDDDQQSFYKYTEKDTVKVSPFIKTQAEKDAYQDSMMVEVTKLQPLPVGRDSRDITDYSVGSIPLEYGVSGSGARTYSVPIFTVPDVKYAPSLSLAYNSQGGYGHGGYGWDIGGLSSITLTGKTKYWDDTIKAPSAPDTAGVFCLDGVRLVTNDDSASASSYPLVTAKGHILVAPHRNIQNFITTFTVLYPDGTVAEYGTGTNQNFTMPAYPVTRTTAITGEKIEYTYTFDELDTLDTRPTLKEIRYGFNNSGTATGKITFAYIFNTAYSYYAGRKMTRLPRLGLIQSFSGNTCLYTYNLSYRSATDGELLSSISITNAAGDQLPPLEFTYGIDDPSYPDAHTLSVADTISLGSYFYSGQSIIYRRGKFIKGSYDDGLLAYKDEPIFSQNASTGKFYYSYGSNYPIIFTPSLSEAATNGVFFAGSGFQSAEVVDVDGDGIDEFVKVNGGATTSAGTTFAISVFRYDPVADTVLSVTTHTITLSGRLYYNGSYHPYRRTYRWGDFLGNGKTQLLAVSYSNNGYGNGQTPYTALIDLDTGATLSQQTYLFSLPSDKDRWLLCTDVDADGRTELCFASTDGLKVYRYGSGGFYHEKTFSIIPQSRIGSSKTYYADLNSDGYIDIVSAPTSRNTWTFYINTGTGFEIRTQNLFLASGSSFMFFDIDRDGYPDLVKVSNNKLYVYRNRRGMTFDTSYSVYISIPSNGAMLQPNIMEHSTMSCFAIVDGQYIYPYVYSDYAPPLRQLVQSTDSYGKIVRNTYGYLPKAGLYWTDNPSNINNSAGYQLRVLPIYVLTGAKGFMSEVSNAKVFLNETYSWYDPVVHTRGLGFCGFSKTRVHSSYDGTYQTTVSRFDPQRLGILTETVMHPYTESYPAFYDITYTYDNHLEHGKPAPRLTQSAVTKSIDGVLTTTSYIYDDFNFPVRVVTQKSSASATPSPSSVVTRYVHSNSPSRYVLGVVASQTSLSSRTLSTPSAMGSKKVFTYDTLYRPVRCETYRVTGTVPAHIADSAYCTLYHASTDLWQYDAFGNVTREESAPSGSLVFTGTSYTYDASGRHLVSSTDRLGLTTSYSDFDIYGNPSVVTNHKGQQTHSYRDGWGRVTRTVHPDGTVDSLIRTWGGIGVYQETSMSSGKPDIIVDYDAAGREVLRSNRRFDGQLQKVQTKYNQNGNVSQVSLPYRGTAPSHWNFYIYDRYNRLTSIREPSGRKTTWSYSGTTVTERKDGIRTVRTTNPAGLLVSVADSLNTITYTYRDDGQPSSVTTSTGATTTFAYDTLGRRTSITDPSAGTRNTAYSINANGSSSITETNALGSIITLYDSLGRVTSIVRPDFNTTFTYDTCGRMVSKVSTNGTAERYTYDAYDRLLTAKDSVLDGKWLQKAYYYDSYGRLSSLSYTNQNGYITSELYYYTNGHNYKTTMPDGTVIYQLTAENNLGQPTSATTGSVSRTYGYTTYGTTTYRKLGNGSLQDFRYTLDETTGNLTNRSRYTSGSLSTSENFTYDNLGRLTGAGGSTISYDADNNITSMGGVGTMSYYGDVHPYTLTGLDEQSTDATGTSSQTYTYKAYDRPATISQGNITVTYTYNSDYDRVKMVMYQSGFSNLSVKHYVGDRYETEWDPVYEHETQLLYLGGNAYSAPMVLKKVDSGSWTPYVIGRDYLGSITHIATTSGTLVEERSYNAWGRLRNPSTNAVYSASSQPSLFLGRGWCGHEYIKYFGLINMNARLYDPILGRFLSPDPYIQAPDFPGNFNRYAYCLNNPLKYSDPTGEFLTWSLGLRGFSIGINFTPIGVPLGFGFNIGWGDGFSMGIYGEAGYRVGGTGMGTGITTSYSYDYNFTRNFGSCTFSIGAYASFGLLSASASVSSSAGQIGWNVGVGVGTGDGISGVGLSLSYGSSGWNFGLGGYYDSSKAIAFSRSLQGMGINDGNPLDPSDELLRQLQEEWYPDAPMDNIENFSVEHVPDKAKQYLNDLERALTWPPSRKEYYAKQISVYFSDLAFESARILYYTMGHEFVHVCNYLTAAELNIPYSTVHSKRFVKMSEFWAYSFQYQYEPFPYQYDINAVLSFSPDILAYFLYQRMPWYNTRKY